MSIAQTNHMRAGVERQMHHRCTIQRNTATKDSLNNPLPADWNDLTADVPCYVWQGASKGETRAVDLVAVVNQWRMLLPIGTDITEADRLSSIVDEFGVQWNTKPVTIQAIARRNTHLLLVLDEVR